MVKVLCIAVAAIIALEHINILTRLSVFNIIFLTLFIQTDYFLVHKALGGQYRHLKLPTS
jgi:hypothetical protein